MLNIFTDKSTIKNYIRAAAVTFRVKEGRVYYIDTEGVTVRIIQSKLCRYSDEEDINCKKSYE